MRLRRGSMWKLGTGLALCLALIACAARPPPPPPAEGPLIWAGRPIGAPPAPNPALRQALIARADQEWAFFGRQKVVFKGNEESIPHVGAWEDDEGPYSSRVNAYWRTVGKPSLYGMNCQAPWSAAFISWVMQGAGIAEDQFPPAAAHGIYLAQILHTSDQPGRFFVPRRVADYSPNPGDLICASRPSFGGTAVAEYSGPEVLSNAQSHCDLVVGKKDQTLEVIGGNVRNSVSKSILELDGEGRLQATPRRPWFLVLQNRL